MLQNAMLNPRTILSEPSVPVEDATAMSLSVGLYEIACHWFAIPLDKIDSPIPDEIVNRF